MGCQKWLCLCAPIFFTYFWQSRRCVWVNTFIQNSIVGWFFFKTNKRACLFGTLQYTAVCLFSKSIIYPANLIQASHLRVCLKVIPSSPFFLLPKLVQYKVWKASKKTLLPPLPSLLVQPTWSQNLYEVLDDFLSLKSWFNDRMAHWLRF